MTNNFIKWKIKKKIEKLVLVFISLSLFCFVLSLNFEAKKVICEGEICRMEEEKESGEKPILALPYRKWWMNFERGDFKIKGIKSFSLLLK